MLTGVEIEHCVVRFESAPYRAYSMLCFRFSAACTTVIMLIILLCIMHP
jgi:hypothetical protein